MIPMAKRKGDPSKSVMDESSLEGEMIRESFICIGNVNFMRNLTGAVKIVILPE